MSMKYATYAINAFRDATWALKEYSTQYLAYIFLKKTMGGTERQVQQVQGQDWRRVVAAPELTIPKEYAAEKGAEAVRESAYSTRYTFPGRQEYGAVRVFHWPGQEGLKLPFNILKLAGPEGRHFIEYLTEQRLAVPPFVGSKDERGLPNYRHWLSKQTSDEPCMVCSETESFRRHILNLQFLLQGADGLFEAKIPGQAVGKKEVSHKDYTYPAHVFWMSGENPGLTEPVLMVDYPLADSTLYNVAERRSLRMVVFRYEDNQRLSDRENGPVGKKYFDWVAERNGFGFEELVEKTACDVMRVLGRIHAAEVILLGEAYLWNFALTENAKVVNVSDMKGSSMLSCPESYWFESEEDRESITEAVQSEIIKPNITGASAQKRVFEKALRTFDETLARYGKSIPPKDS